MKNVTIEIRSLQNGQEVSYLYTRGVMRRDKDGGTTLRFDGGRLFGEDDSPVTLSVRGNESMTVSTGRGSHYSRFTFETGVTSNCRFPGTGPVSLVGVDARGLDTHIDGAGGDIDLEYALHFDGLPPVVNEMKIAVREQTSDPAGLDGWFARHGAQPS